MANPSEPHILEKRATMLAQRIRQAITDMSLALQAANGRIPFRTPLSKGTALDWWAAHRYDSMGLKALQGFSPLTVLNLDNALNEYTQQKSEQGMPVETSPAPAAPLGNANAA